MQEHHLNKWQVQSVEQAHGVPQRCSYAHVRLSTADTVQFQVEPHPKFRRKGDDIVSSLPLKLTEALLGCSKTVDTVWGSQEVKVPACTRAGAQLVLQGAGAPRLRGVGRGSHILQIDFEAPRTLSPEQRHLIEQLRMQGM
jgi:molecular chaperone DnaJ